MTRRHPKDPDPLATRLLAVATRLLPSADQARYLEEFCAELASIAEAGNSRRSQVAYATRQMASAWWLRTERHALRQPHNDPVEAATGLAALDQAAAEQYAILSRQIERREHERLLHDTVLNTLTALARSGSDDVVKIANRCRLDVALVEAALGGPDDLAVSAWRPSGDLPGGLRGAIAHVRARGLPVMHLIGVLAVLLPSVPLVQVLANARDYRQPAMAIAVWLGVLAAASWLVPRLRTGGLGAGETVAAIAIAVAAVTTTVMAHRPHNALGSVDLAILGTAWLLGLVVMSRPAWVWILGTLFLFTVPGVLLTRNGGPNPLGLTEILTVGCGTAAILIAFAAFRSAMATQAAMAARQASLTSRLAAERAATAAIHQERRGRLAALEGETLPLLRGIACGTLNPTGDDVRKQCAQHAAALRVSLAGGPSGPSELMTALEPALRTAQERGLLVTKQVIGDPGTLSPQIARAALATLDAMLSALPPHQVRLTVLSSGDDVELYLMFDALLLVAPDLTRFGLDLPAVVRWRATVGETEAGGGFLEVSWRKTVLPDQRR